MVPGRAPNLRLVQDFLEANGSDVASLVCYARWACIPFSLLGAYFAFRWADELYGKCAGLLTLVLYVFEPNLLAHGELITPDAACTSFGIMAGYALWRWLKHPTRGRMLFAGVALGLAQSSKFTWIFLFGLWPVMWLCWRLHFRRSGPNGSRCETIPSCQSMALILLIGAYSINFGYAFDGFGTRLEEFRFVSRALSNPDSPDIPGNRFENSWIGTIPIPLVRTRDRSQLTIGNCSHDGTADIRFGEIVRRSPEFSLISIQCRGSVPGAFAGTLKIAAKESHFPLLSIPYSGRVKSP